MEQTDDGRAMSEKDSKGKGKKLKRLNKLRVDWGNRQTKDWEHRLLLPHLDIPAIWHGSLSKQQCNRSADTVVILPHSLSANQPLPAHHPSACWALRVRVCVDRCVFVTKEKKTEWLYKRLSLHMYVWLSEFKGVTKDTHSKFIGAPLAVSARRKTAGLIFL